MLINIIPKVEVNGSYFPDKVEEIKMLTYQPDCLKGHIILYNYWDEAKRSQLSDDAKLYKLVLDFDNGAHREDVQDRFREYEYVIYNSTGNSKKEHLEKFRMIVTLKEPVTALTLRHWYKQDEFKKFPMFKGCDLSSFHIGRYFVAPSKYDKDRDPVIVSYHKGRSFDFHSFFEEQNYMEALFEKQKEELIRKQNASSMKGRRTVENADKILQEYIDKIGLDYTPTGLHYVCLPSVILKGKRLGLDEYTIRKMFNDNYVGSSDWEKNWDVCWSKFNPD